MGFGETLTSFRKKAGLSTRELARRTKISATYVSLAERDQTSPPTEHRIKAIAKAIAIGNGNETERISESEVYNRLMEAAGRLPSEIREILRDPLAIKIVKTFPSLTSKQLHKLLATAIKMEGANDNGEDA